MKRILSMLLCLALVIGFIPAVAQAAEHTNSRDAIDALISLGFTRSEASLAVGKFNPEESTEVLIREALKILAK